MNQYSQYSAEEADLMKASAMSDRSNWRLLRRLLLPKRFNDPRGGKIKRAVVVDVETTGLSIETDDVIQLAVLPFDYDPESGRILSVYKDLAFEGLREPSVPISEEASLVTGITNEMVAGKSIDDEAVAAVAEKADLVIAHNASFDRPMVERLWSVFADKRWACTLSGVNWLREGFTAGKLDYLGMQFGWFYDGHRALVDCEACLALLAQTLPKSGENVMKVVREAAMKDDFLIRAVDAPYDLREKLKKRGYRWRAAELKNGKVWWTITTDPKTEIAWLGKEIYGREAKIPVHTLTARERYSERVWSFSK
jgi:DNA polymerase-3 subunit epsilon